MFNASEPSQISPEATRLQMRSVATFQPQRCISDINCCYLSVSVLLKFNANLYSFIFLCFGINSFTSISYLMHPLLVKNIPKVGFARRGYFPRVDGHQNCSQFILEIQQYESKLSIIFFQFLNLLSLGQYSSFFDLKLSFFNIRIYIIKLLNCNNGLSRIILAISIFSPDEKVVVALLFQPIFGHVHACPHIVKVGHLRQVGHSPVGHLKHRQADSHIPSRTKVLPSFVLESRVAHLQEKPNIVSAEVTHSEGIAPVRIVFYDGGVIRPGVTYFELRGKRVGVGEPYLLLLKNSIEKLEYLPTDQLVVSIHYHHDLTRTTKLHCS